MPEYRIELTLRHAGAQSFLPGFSRPLDATLGIRPGLQRPLVEVAYQRAQLAPSVGTCGDCADSELSGHMNLGKSKQSLYWRPSLFVTVQYRNLIQHFPEKENYYEYRNADIMYVSSLWDNIN
jgi:hypothetical protein